MLILSRKSSEEISFPSIGISIKVVRVKGSVVQLGIEAPSYIRVLRREMLAGGLLEPIAALAEPSTDHDFRNKLNELILQIQLAIHARPDQLTTTGLALRRLLSDLNEPAADDSESGPSSKEKRATILVVDDVANERQLFASILQLRGFDVVEATDGDHALKILSASQLPAAVLLDLEMPRVMGERVLRSIRGDQRLASLKVVAVSARPPRLHEIPGSLPGFDAWFSKPLDFEKLSNLLLDLTQSSESFSHGKKSTSAKTVAIAGG